MKKTNAGQVEWVLVFCARGGFPSIDALILLDRLSKRNAGRESINVFDTPIAIDFFRGLYSRDTCAIEKSNDPAIRALADRFSAEKAAAISSVDAVIKAAKP